MPKREIVPEPIVTVIDDYDGKELHPDTPPERYRINGRTYDLYLSDESKKVVDDFLRNLLDGAEEVRDTAPPRRRGGSSGVTIRDGYTIQDLREWATRQRAPGQRQPARAVQGHRGVQRRALLSTRRDVSSSKQPGVVHRDRDLHAVGRVELGEDVRDVRLDRGHATCGGRRRSRRWTSRHRRRSRPRARGRSGRPPATSPPHRSGCPGAASVTWRISCCVIVGDSIGSPSTTLPIAATISAGGVSLSRNPLAPAASARTTYSSASNVVSTMTFGGSGSGEDLGGRGDAVQHRHAYVHQHHVDATRPYGVDRLLAVGGLPDDRDVVRPAEDERQPRAHQRVVVGQQHAGGHAGHGSHASTTNSRSGVIRCVIRPPTSAVRSASPIRPSPDSGASTPIEPISSGLRHRDRSTRPTGCPVTETVTSVLGACLRAFVRLSCTTR